MPHPIDFLPTTRQEMNALGWDSLDVLLITGDAYFDHPSHGVAMIGRVLLDAGYKVAIIPRPNWKESRSLTEMGRPRLFVGVSAGAVDSTLNNYTADLAPRKDDAYAPENASIPRPNYATAVYCGAVKQAFGRIPIVLGGIEASTRRFAYYDYLKKGIRRSVLLDTRADILVYGPGEKTILEIAQRLNQQQPLSGIRGTAILTRTSNNDATVLPTFTEVSNDRNALLLQTDLLEHQSGPFKETTFMQKYDEGIVLCHPPVTQTQEDLDRWHALPFSRKLHPRYDTRIKAFETIKFSVISQRGCPGGCSFCALAYHQGRRVIPRSAASLVQEIRTIANMEHFTGTITDVGGPTANAYGVQPKDKSKCLNCRRNACLHPGICNNLTIDHSVYLKMLQQLKSVPGIKHLFIASGIRHDLALRDIRFIEKLATEYTGGHLKAAPEHCADNVLKLMRKPPIHVFEKFESEFRKWGKQRGKEQFVVPYFIAGFPGCTAHDADVAGQWLRNRGQKLEQVQNFIPLPGTMAAAMYACGKTSDGTPIEIPSPQERKRQKSILVHGGILPKKDARFKEAQQGKGNDNRQQNKPQRRNVHETSARSGAGSSRTKRSSGGRRHRKRRW